LLVYRYLDYEFDSNFLLEDITVSGPAPGAKFYFCGSCSRPYPMTFINLSMHVGSWLILLKSSIKLESCFSVNNQKIMNFPQQPVGEFTSGSVGGCLSHPEAEVIEVWGLCSHSLLHLSPLGF